MSINVRPSRQTLRRIRQLTAANEYLELLFEAGNEVILNNDHREAVVDELIYYAINAQRLLKM